MPIKRGTSPAACRTSRAGSIGRRRSWDGASGYDHTETVKAYYDLCSGFMVWGWGESLHFAPLAPHESIEDSKVRHQRLMIDKLELQRGMRVIDVGCGIGGPIAPRRP